MEEPRSATPYLKVFMSHVSCLPVRRSSLPAPKRTLTSAPRASQNPPHTLPFDSLALLVTGDSEQIRVLC